MPDTPDPAPPDLLTPADPPAWRTVRADSPGPLLLLCDHASKAVPQRLGDLGLAPEALADHIGWDIGAAAVTERVSALMDAPALFTGFSRLVIDCNRLLDTPGSIPAISDGVAVPGNRDLSPADAAARAAACFWPYHRAVRDQIARMRATGVVPALVFVHTFTPRMAGQDRPWHVGVLWNRDPRLALPLLDAFRGEAGLVVGDNEPYSGRDERGYSLHVHGGGNGLPHVLIEIRQDLVAGAAGARAWGDRLARHLAPILADPTLAQVAYYDGR